MNWFDAEPWSAEYILGYTIFVFPVYQTLLLLTAFIFGQFDFFWNRYKKAFERARSLIN